ncbi:hypothetical protein Vadar_012495 [Vaccinium darrowii]|uniref:Uncharacterized protein n=1 Tax=Vaccinium darrowii TaxID=229202 RepID=A0ACB7XIA1_9ERIC|nr:hypothetical protein Vadar_012495 [Vaccinium darrowii]
MQMGGLWRSAIDLWVEVQSSYINQCIHRYLRCPTTHCCILLMTTKVTTVEEEMLCNPRLTKDEETFKNIMKKAFGEFRSGKTQLAHTLCVTTQVIGSHGRI